MSDCLPSLAYNNGKMKLNIPSSIIDSRFGECGLTLSSNEVDMPDITLEVARRIAKKLKVGLWIGDGDDFMPEFNEFEEYTENE